MCKELKLSTDELPIILIRGWGGPDISDERRLTHQGFNVGTVYPQKRGPNYIYEGLILRFLKDTVHTYRDATNVLKYSSSGDIIEDETRIMLQQFRNVRNSLWVYRYYDFERRDIGLYGRQLAKVVETVKEITSAPQVNIIAHSMGGLIARWLLQREYRDTSEAEEHINKVVTLGTPHGGINFAEIAGSMDTGIEVEYFSKHWLDNNLGGSQKDRFDISESFNPKAMLCIIGTNRWAYASPIKLIVGKHSDGLVQHKNAKVNGANTAYVHKCHGGTDSLVTSREAFEIASRFFFGDKLVTITRRKGTILGTYEGLFRGGIGNPEYFIGHSLKPRGIDFFLNSQSKSGENCDGPYHSNKLPANQVVYRGFLDTKRILPDDPKDIVFRFDIYIGERDSYGIGYSDTKVLHQQCEFQYVLASNKLVFVSDSQKLECKLKGNSASTSGTFGPFKVEFPTYVAEYIVEVTDFSGNKDGENLNGGEL